MANSFKDQAGSIVILQNAGLAVFFNIPIFLLLFTLNLLAVSRSFAQEITIGVPLAEQPINFLNSDHPLAQLVLSSSTQSLIKVNRGTQGSVKLVLADSLSVNLGGKVIELRLRAAAAFLNSKPVDSVDLKASLQRCENSLDADFKARYQVSPRFEVYRKEQRLRVEVRSEQGSEAIFEFLDKCPILEERSLRLFGDDLGSANLILGTGPYQIVSRVKNREVRMERAAKSSAWAAVLTARGFADSGHALTAIRSGTIDAFYTQDLNVLEQAGHDTTLLIRPCGVYNVILRTGLEFSCTPFLDPGSIKYTAL